MDNNEPNENDNDQKIDSNSDEGSTSDSLSWGEFLSEKGLDSDLILKIVGVIVILVLIKMALSSRKIKKLKQQLGEVNAAWGKIDFDGDGEISDAEFEAYKILRDKDSQEEEVEEIEQNNPDDESASAVAGNDGINNDQSTLGTSVDDWLLEELG